MVLFESYISIDVSKGRNECCFDSVQRYVMSMVVLSS